MDRDYTVLSPPFPKKYKKICYFLFLPAVYELRALLGIQTKLGDPKIMQRLPFI